MTNGSLFPTASKRLWRRNGKRASADLASADPAGGVQVAIRPKQTRAITAAGGIEAKQLSSNDAENLRLQCRKASKAVVQSEEDVLRWLAKEYDLTYTSLDDVEPDRQLLSLFPARLLLKDELLPLRRINGCVEVATSRLFATQGLDTLKTMTGLKLKPVIAPREAIQREMKKRLGVGADTIDTLGEETSFQVVDDERDDDTNLDSAAEDAS